MEKKRVLREEKNYHITHIKTKSLYSSFRVIARLYRVAFKREPVDITESKPVSDKSLFLAVLFLWTLFATKALFQSQSSPQLFGFFVYFQRLDGHPPRYVGKWRT
ncbi:hypothetical protein RB195_014974 [Necator americanus]|uniref:Bestrophin homolog n=1 Tax=Necator americanus TaxID=51031 RepID=A0ABR1E2X4_NECAM